MVDNLTDAEVVYMSQPTVIRVFGIIDEEKTKSGFSATGDPFRDTIAKSYWDTMRICRGEFPVNDTFRFEFWIPELNKNCTAYVISDNHADALKRGSIIVTALGGKLQAVQLPVNAP